MKYIMLETEHGAKLPFIFPDIMTHSVVALYMQHMLQSVHKLGKVTAASAGFVGMGLDIEVSGESESMIGLESNPNDAARIMLGDAIQFMPDAMLQPLMSKLLAEKGK